ncbi:EamA family transporter [Saccharibacillus sp. CPCC 101409]|uniref:EamA family transporter n=1 Tax=Saccharibacillus sp. CPCC 101409 TaxID=3058041 RepID=UPI002673BCA5|nr:EamA family transporter [Saccharibacillus sp. CPCC 101409]MDO3412378.1 EamA family transporter [Saccharibacillus sp. CPCC 101409]
MWFGYAILAAACFGVRGILYQWTSQRPADRNLLFVGVYLSGALISLLLNLHARQPWNDGVGFGVLMGLFSFAANASLYKGYEVGRASVVAFFSALTPLVVVLAAFFLWGEALGAMQGAGFAVVILALVVVRYGQDLRSGQLRGWTWGMLAMGLYSFTDLSSKQSVLAGASMLPVLTAMFVTGTLLFLGMVVVSRYRKRSESRRSAGGSGSSVHHVLDDVERPAQPSAPAKPAWTSRRTLLWGMTVGLTNIVGMIMMLSALAGGITGIVSAIVALNIVIVLLYARFYLKETMSRREGFGIALAFAGILVLRLAS